MWADEDVSSPVHLQPYTPAYRLPKGNRDPAFRPTPQITAELVDVALEVGFSFCTGLYGEQAEFVGPCWRGSNSPYWRCG